MTIEITMPALSPTMTEGKLAKWLVREGDAVAAGDVIAEIETDKATMEIEVTDDGVLGKILVAEGAEEIAVGSPIALIAEDGEDIADLNAPAPAPKAMEPESPQPAAPTADTPAQAKTGRVAASPLARRLAGERSINLAEVTGSGPRGRVVKRDIEAFEPAAPATTPKLAALGPAAEFEEIKLSMMRKTIARRLSEAKRDVPHFYLTVDIEIDELLELRKKLNARADGFKLSVNDFIIRAMAVALAKVPDANVQFAGDKLLRFKRADVSVAVAIEGGLVTPVVHAAETKGLRQISGEMKALAEKARAGRLTPEDYEGGAISLSNLGMFGIKNFDAVINPPQAAILAVGAGEQRAVVKDGALAVATVMSATMSCDHRAINGATGAQYLNAVKDLLEDPLRLLI
ncbi:MAG: pyruvate dehydrogenase complex dihydrolipoamide acetyltransferase [Sphingomonadales bacterium]